MKHFFCFISKEKKFFTNHILNKYTGIDVVADKINVELNIYF